MASSSVTVHPPPITPTELSTTTLFSPPPALLLPSAVTTRTTVAAIAPDKTNLAFVQPWKQASPSVQRLLAPRTTLIAPTDSLRETLQVQSKAQPVARPRVIGHRGALYDYLENTREAFLRCVDLNCDAVELDVFTLADGTVIVFHGGGSDANPGDLSDYCLNQAGVGILDLTYPQTQELLFNPKHTEFPCPPSEITNARIPTLQQVLQDLKGTGLEVKIELKGPQTVQPVLGIVESLQMTDQCSYSSFHHERLYQLRQLRPDKALYPTAALFDKNIPADFVQCAVDCGATAVHLQYDTCTVARIDAIHQAGLDSMAWFRGPVGMRADTATKYKDVGNEDAACYQAVIDTGVDELCVNRPDVLLQVLNRGLAATPADTLVLP